VPEAAGERPLRAPAVAVLDVESGLRRALLDRGFYVELLGIFLDDYGPAAQDIRASLAEGRRSEALRIAHSAKGEAANISAEEVRLRAAICEAILRDGRDAELPAALSALESALGRTAEAIGAYRESSGQGRGEAAGAAAGRGNAS